MKFGHELWRNQVPEWANSYINYKALKKLVRAASVSLKTTGDADLAEIFFSLDRNLEDVDHFYKRKLSEYTRRLKLLHDRYGPLGDSINAVDADEHQDLVTALLEIRAQLRKLQWYGEVNRRGFDKILKKLDKKVPNVCSQRRYLVTKVFPASFSSNTEIAELTKLISKNLSVIGENQVPDNDTLINSLVFPKPTAPKNSLAILSGTSGEKVEAFLRADDAQSLLTFLAEKGVSDSDGTKLYINVLQKAISTRARKCTVAVLERLESLQESDDMNGRNCVHRLVISISRARDAELQRSEDSLASQTALSFDKVNGSKFITPAEVPTINSRKLTTSEQESIRLLSRTDQSLQFFDFFLDSLKPEQRQAIYARDSYDRTPLHYAAEYGYVVICEMLLERMRKWARTIFANVIDSTPWLDRDGFSPLHHAVIGGHPLASKVLHSFEFSLTANERAGQDINPQRANELLMVATKSDFVRIVKLLLDFGASPISQDDQGECALHIAARHGRAEVAKLLISVTKANKQSIDIPDRAFGWTPLFTAAVDGHLDVLNLLINAGADLTRADLSGWTAKEHAGLRGHMNIMFRLGELTPTISSAEFEDSESNSRVSKAGLTALGDRRSKPSQTHEKLVDSVKTFGHRYLTNESMILLTLGSKDMRTKSQAVTLDQIPLSDAHATQLDTALSIVISATGATGEPAVFDLPTQESISTDPVYFMSKDPSKAKIIFDIVPTYAGTRDRIVGRAVALINSVTSSIGLNRMTLQGDVNVPILSTMNMNVIGTVNFNFLIITPFSHPKMNISEEHTYWKKVESTMLIGHRGMGANAAKRGSLQLGENTIQAFIAAANLGASYVEFDVQMTKDHVPVIYHDFLVSETGIDAPVHTLTLDQFLNLSDQPASFDRNFSHIEHSTSWSDSHPKESGTRKRSSSAGARKSDRTQKEATKFRMRHTRDFKLKGFKANSRGDFIQESFTTLEQMFEKVPLNTGFNIEMKYPMLSETVEHDMDMYAIELNSFVDNVLKMVYDRANGRNIIFSTFHPDICLLLSLKQPSIPVMFLTNAGVEEVSDIRASNIQEAIRFASRWNLLGVVSNAQPIIACPRLVRVVKESGLVCVTYGSQNSDPAMVRLQVNEGIDAVIVDSVLAIRQELTERTSSDKKEDVGSDSGSAEAGLVIPKSVVDDVSAMVTAEAA